ncbi:MAG: hypothetical protein V1712_04305 [Patescibacteria group bacterium]
MFLLFKKFRKYIFVLVLLFPVMALAATFSLENPLGNIGSPVEIFARVAVMLSLFTGISALVFFVLGGFRILTAAGSQEKFAKGKTMIVYSALGFVVTISSYYILITLVNILTQGQTTGLTTASGLVDPLGKDWSDPTSGAAFYGRTILGYLVGSLGAVTLLVFVYAGWLWLTAAGNEEKVTKAKQTIMYGVIGLVAILGSYTILRFVYTPFYNLLYTGEVATVEEDNLQDGPSGPATTAACFRDGICEIMTKADCLAATPPPEFVGPVQPGQFYLKKTCDDLGCCQQVANRAFGEDPLEVSRISPSKCVPNRWPAADNAGYWGCPRIGELVQLGSKCFVDVKFTPGYDCDQVP